MKWGTRGGGTPKSMNNGIYWVRADQGHGSGGGLDPGIGFLAIFLAIAFWPITLIAVLIGIVQAAVNSPPRVKPVPQKLLDRAAALSGVSFDPDTEEGKLHLKKIEEITREIRALGHDVEVTTTKSS